ncbi:Fic family protein [Gemmatimonas sp.]|uniref:Fic family protein n=1 Tax=Gemmatimonas sp. TaxID=1962908 RepID=UPI0025B7A8BD|nr:Fic family protein [Gemmatimonas sp.]MCA2983648.1 Fic family protein [Gemmatimonas sp.]
MKVPLSPPDLHQVLSGLLAAPSGAQRLQELLSLDLGPAPGGKYRHWDTFRHAPPRADFSAKEQWFAVKSARNALARPLPLTDTRQRPFKVALPAPALAMLHRVDRDAAGNLSGAFVGTEPITNPATRETYLFKSIVEEAITSSQLEGASTTRNVAKDMIQNGRPPFTRSERMILNNYQGMLLVRHHVHAPLTPEFLLELQRTLTGGTLDDESAAGRLRTADEHIVIEDETGVVLHTPPTADVLGDRMRALCDFANGTNDSEFVHPVVRAILLHLWLAYDHPFVDGNGRTARALFYWSMVRAGYWLCEYVSISRILKKARGQYARAYLYTETDDNDATYFLLYQLRVLCRAIDDLEEYLHRKARQLHDIERLVHRASLDGLNPRQLALVRHALTSEFARYTVASHQRSHGTSYETARSDLLRLVQLGLLRQSKQGKAFVFHPAADIHQRIPSDR